ncbi:MAG TPA: ATP-dependent metalloprotease [Oceanospirillales bacterium]|jgi:cell division protease FtsH|uniref:ATP-dependent zinc metalloprotease FtsH n=1 Tax=Thalassolituus sp. TaxID=2030822 RepID=UPI000C58E1DD|nr:ATP-dependent zinc metalloprotease FtsH [Thalassolituus sp.]MAE34035.1 ATP-dependent metalloprotease [Oceanospirillaceae bacterium]MDQ4423312.1 ATP-dependent zinc metalloprotease FtsH [Thalassolituus sp.]MDQ4426231.1 ATP-dependent zinc metalloprotease FtsH [Thalassolituus sp.]HCG79568.1 ATP-dependent metalloprotease [Oceanospirillales bacterium]|tara:strand:+ start:156 stop:2093 length:1938 start_codon:yes stop_codon:yes gene_type:complete
MAKNFVLWAVIAAVLMMVFQGLNPVDRSNSWSYSEFMKAVESGQVESVTISGQSIKGTSRGGQAFESVLPAFDDKLMDTLLVNDVEVIGEKPEKQSFLSQLLLASLPILIIIAVFMLFMRQMQGGGSGRGGPMAFGKSKAKLLSEDQIKTTFGDVAGCDEAKEDVKELVEFLREPGKYQKLGGKIPRGVLMVGQPGTGKTLLAKAIAGEARVPFFSISGSDFVEMFVGVGASRVRDMFEQAKKQAPCIIFIDEIDAVGRSRGVGIGGGNDEREQTLNQLLVEMDGFEVNDGIIVIAATNRPDVLDPALLRPGRFDRQVVVGLPDIRGREQILQVHMKKAPVSDDVNASLIARGTPGFSGADLANLVNEAALFAARANRSEVTMEEFEKAKDKILMGAERKTMVMSEKEKENTAYHEAGHAIVGRLVPEHDPVYKVSIIPRGRALGVTMFLPEEDRHSISKRGIESNICSLYGGRIAEELTLGKEGVTTGASNDIERATKYARNYVTKWGLSDKLGAQLYSEDEQGGYLGSSGGGQMAHLSDDTARTIDSEVKELLDSCYQRATQILVDNRDKLEMMKDALMEYETIDSDQIDDIMSGTKPRPPKGWGDGSGGSPAMSADDSVEKESRDMASDDDDVAGEPAGERQ